MGDTVFLLLQSFILLSIAMVYIELIKVSKKTPKISSQKSLDGTEMLKRIERYLLENHVGEELRLLSYSTKHGISKYEIDSELYIVLYSNNEGVVHTVLSRGKNDVKWIVRANNVYI